MFQAGPVRRLASGLSTIQELQDEASVNGGGLKGGIVATLFALPIELIYGSIAIAPLGAVNSSLGIQAAL